MEIYYKPNLHKLHFEQSLFAFFKGDVIFRFQCTLQKHILQFFLIKQFFEIEVQQNENFIFHLINWFEKKKKLKRNLKKQIEINKPFQMISNSCTQLSFYVFFQLRHHHLLA